MDFSIPAKKVSVMQAVDDMVARIGLEMPIEPVIVSSAGLFTYVAWKFMSKDMEAYTAAQVAWNAMELKGDLLGGHIQYHSADHVVVNGKVVRKVKDMSENEFISAVMQCVSDCKRNRIGIPIAVREVL